MDRSIQSGGHYALQSSVPHLRAERLGRAVGDMSEATFERVLAGLRDLPELGEVVFGGYGEPVAHPHTLDYVRPAKDLGVKVTVSTNDTLLDER
ncbi:MAG: hypothetical protein PVG71_16415 [Anaerolineae bacterium]|jgi:MoaA/NifB/PqqE/SkfB family radical SAM enzyme